MSPRVLSTTEERAAAAAAVEVARRTGDLMRLRAARRWHAAVSANDTQAFDAVGGEGRNLPVEAGARHR
jgi:hypothetical protein